MAVKSEKLTFPGADGSMLAARLDRPDDRPVAAHALFAHCFTCSKESVAASRIARALAGRGIATLRFDFTGLGSSDGDFANTNFSSNVGDLKAAVAHMRGTLGAPALLIGHSLGGAAVLAAAGEVAEARAVVTIGAPFDPAHVAHHFDEARDTILAEGEAQVTLGGRPFRIKKQFLRDIEAQAQDARIAGLKRALLVFHAPRDETVGIENAEHIYKAAKHPKSFVSLDDADHLLMNKRDAGYVAEVLAAWASRYLDAAQVDEAVAPAPADAPPPGVVRVRETRRGKFAQVVRAGRHALPADEPTGIPGGTDTGPTPYDYLLAGLGACTAMTLRLYAERKGWPMDWVEVELAHERVHAEDCADCETKEGRIDQITRALRIEGALSPDQRARLLAIADKCPVHRTLENEIKIRTGLKG